MRDISLSADEKMIEAAWRRAVAENTTLNAQFRLWLAEYVRGEWQVARAMRTVRELQGKLHIGRKLTREEMNER